MIRAALQSSSPVSHRWLLFIVHCFVQEHNDTAEEEQGWSLIVKVLQSMCSVLGPIPESHIKRKKANSEPIFKNTINTKFKCNKAKLHLTKSGMGIDWGGFSRIRIFYKMRIKKVTQLKTLSELNIYTKWIYLNCKILYSLYYSSKIFSLHFFQSYGPLKQLRKNKSLLLLYVNVATLITENM